MISYVRFAAADCEGLKLGFDGRGVLSSAPHFLEKERFVPEYVVTFDAADVEALRLSMQRGEIHEIHPDGSQTVSIRKAEVDRFKGLKVEIFSNEHPPPHFRVRFQNSSANFRIDTCALLNGGGEVLKYENNIRLWWRDNKEKLIQFWNERRPSNCPVGRYAG